MNTLSGNWLAHGAYYYFRYCPLQRGKGHVNRWLGRFLRISLPGGAKLRLTNPLEHAQEMLMTNRYEPDCTRVLLDHLQPGMVVFDVGANIGYYTLLASKQVGPTGRVHSFEPAPAQYRDLQRNVEGNRLTNVHLNNCALAERTEERKLFLSTSWNQGLHSLGKGQGHSESCRVQCLTLDEYVARNQVKRLDVLKIDVEGAEMLVLQGAEKTLRMLSPSLILFEACEEHYGRLGFSTNEAKAFLIKLGYVLLKVEPSVGEIPVSANDKEIYANLVARRRS